MIWRNDPEVLGIALGTPGKIWQEAKFWKLKKIFFYIERSKKLFKAKSDIRLLNFSPFAIWESLIRIYDVNAMTWPWRTENSGRNAWEYLTSKQTFWKYSKLTPRETNRMNKPNISKSKEFIEKERNVRESLRLSIEQELVGDMIR